MPHSDLHKTKLKKNLAVLAIVVGLCALIWGITMVKISEGSKKAAEIQAEAQTEKSKRPIEE